MPSDTDFAEHDWYSNETATFGDRLVAARGAVAMSQEELARRLGIRILTLDSWENDLSEPRANRLSMLAGLLNVSLRWLMTGEGEGLTAPLADEGVSDDIHKMMTELREMQRDLVRQADQLGRLQKRLRLTLDAPE